MHGVVVSSSFSLLLHFPIRRWIKKQAKRNKTKQKMKQTEVEK